MFGLFIDKERLEEEAKKISEKSSECEKKIEEVMYNRLGVMGEKLNDDDHKKINIEIKELYELINNAYKPVKKYFVKNIFSTTIKEFNFDKFKEQLKMTVYLKLIENGKIIIQGD